METVSRVIEQPKSDDCDVRWHAARILRLTKDARLSALSCAL